MLARCSIGILDEIDRRDIGKIALGRLIQKREGTIAVCVCLNWPGDQVTEHLGVLDDNCLEAFREF